MKEQILQKATELFLNQGFKSITMDDIAQEMSISKKTIYSHFGNKEAIVSATTNYLFETICGGIELICEFQKNPINELYDIQYDYMQNCVVDNIKRGLEQGLFRENINVDFVARIYFMGINSIKDREIFPADQFPSRNY